MKWVSRFKDKVSFQQTQSGLSVRDQFANSANGSFNSRTDHESELDFKRFWEEFRSCTSDKEKEEALERAVDVFCKLAKRSENSIQIVNTLVDSRVFSFMVAKALVTEINKLRKLCTNGGRDTPQILYFFMEASNEGIGVGANLLYALECLVSPPLDVQPLLDAGLLSCLVWVLHTVLGQPTTKEISHVTLKEHVDGDLEHIYAVERSIIHIIKALAQHTGATLSLAEDDSLQLLFYIVGMTSLPSLDNADDFKPPFSVAQLHRQALQILTLLLNNDNGSSAQYIHKYQLVKVLLRVVRDFDVNAQDPEYAVDVVDVLLECIELSCRGESTVRLRDDLQNAHGYHFLVQFALNLLEKGASFGEESIPSKKSIYDTEESLASSIQMEAITYSPEGALPPVLTRLLDILVNLAQVGVSGANCKNFGPAKPSSRSFLFSDAGVTSTQDKQGEGKVKDVEAVQVLQDIFLKTNDERLQLEILDRLLRIFASHSENYRLCQELRTIPLFILNMAKFSDILQERLLKILEYAVTVVNYVPEQELLSLCCLLQQPLPTSLAQKILSFFTKLLSFDKMYKKVLREVGALEVLVDDIKKLECLSLPDSQKPPLKSIAERKAVQGCKDLANEMSLRALSFSNQDVGHLLTKAQLFNHDSTLSNAWDCLITLIKTAEGNQMAFRKANGVALALPLLNISCHRGGVLRLLNCLISEDVNQSHSEELGALIDVAKSGVVANTTGQQIKVDFETKRDVLWAIHRILSVNIACKDVFGAATGFSLLFTVLHSFQAGQELLKLSSSNNVNQGVPSTLSLYMEVFDAMMNVVKAAVSGNPVNRGRLCKVISSQTFKELLRDSGLLSPKHEEKVADLLLSLALEKKGQLGGLLVLPHVLAPSNSSTCGGQEASDGMDLGVMAARIDTVSVDFVPNPGAVEVLIDCLTCLSSGLQLNVLEVVKRLAQACAFNQDCLTSAGCVSLLLDIAKSATGNPVLLGRVLSIVEILGSYRLSSIELRTLARWVWLCKDSADKEFGHIFVDSMKRMIYLENVGSENGNTATFVEMSQGQSGYSYMRISLGDRMWPPTAGYSFVCWLRYKVLPRSLSVAAEEASKKQPSRGRAGTAGREHAKFKIFSVGSAEEKSQLFAEFYMEESGTLALATSATSYLSFKGVFLEENMWHHVVVVHNKPNALTGLFQSSTACLYVNGRLRQTGKLGYSASPAGKSLQGTIGTPPSNVEVCPLSWNLGTCYLYEEVLSPPSIFLMYALGRGYRGLFQDTDLLRFMPYDACGGGNLATFEVLEVELALGTSNQKAESSLKTVANKTDGSGVVWDLDRLSTFAPQLACKRLIFCFDGTSVDTCMVRTSAVINLVDSLAASASPLGGLPLVARLHGNVSICSPCGLGENIRKIGGVAVVLALVEAAGSKEVLHLALGLLTSILRWNPYNVRDMSATRGYHLLALFLRHQMSFVDMQHLDTLFQIAACEASIVSTGKIAVLDSNINSVTSGSISSSASYSFESSSGFKETGEGSSSFGSQIDSTDYFQQDTLSYISDMETPELSTEVCNSLVLANPEMMEYVLLDWTLWVAAPVTVQLALIGFIERLVSMHRYRNHNLTMLRRVNIVQHLLVTLQRGDVEVPVLEKLVVLLGIILEDGFLTSELKCVVDFVVMSFEPPEVINRSTIPRETMGIQVIVRNMLLEMLIDLQVTISTEEVLELWHKIVSSKLITFLLDEAVHPTSMRWVMTLLGVCLSSSTTFSSKFRNSGGFHGLVQILPSFFDCPELYYILFCLMFGKSVYPRQPEVRLLDFHALMPDNGGSGEMLFTDFIEAIIAMAKAAFDRLFMRLQSIEQMGDQLPRGDSIDEIFRGLAESTEQEQLQGEALLHKTYAARLLGGEVASPGVVTSIIRYMVDLVKMCQPFSAAMRRQELLESCVEFYFSCVRSVYAAQSFQYKALGEQQNPVDTEEENSSYLASSDSMNGLMQRKNVAQRLPEPRTLSVVDTVVTIPRTISSGKEINIIPTLEEDSLPSEDIVCDVNVFAMDSLDHLVALAAISAPAEKIEHEEKSFSRANAFAESVGGLLPPVAPGSPGSDASGLLSGGRSAYSTPYDVSTSWMASSSRSETHLGASSLATLSTAMSGLNSEFYYRQTTRFPESSFVEIKPELLLKLDTMGSGGGPCYAASVAVLDLIAEVLADGISEQIKGTVLVDAILESAPLYITAEAALAFQGLCLGRLMVYFERRILRDDEEVNKRLDKNKWSSNLDAFSNLIVDRVYMGAFMEPGSVLKILEFLLSMLQLANKDRRVEQATLTGKGLLSRSRGASRQVEGYIQSLLKNVNRMIMYCFTPVFLSAIGEDDLIISNLPRTDVKRFDDGDGGFLSAAMDICTVLQIVIANRQLIFCSINLSTDLVCCLCINSITMLWDSRPSVRMLAVEVTKSLIAFRKPVLEELLVVRPNQGDALDVLHGGLDRLLMNDLAQFYVWFRNSKEVISKVLEQCASITWMQYVTNASKFPGIHMKLGESRRKREMSRRHRDISKLEDRHWEQMSERRYALDVVRDEMATDLRAVRQEKYGWVLHAESEWQVHVQHLVHERGILPMLKVRSTDGPGWELCATEGPYRMRKKLVRIKVKVSMSSTNQSRLDPGAALGEAKLSGREVIGLDITDPDYDSFFHLFSVGNTSQKDMSYSNEEFSEVYDEEDDDKMQEEESTSSSARTGLNTLQSLSENGLEMGPARTSSTFSAQTSTIGDFSQSHQSSPKQSLQMSEELKYEGGKVDKDVNDDGEYLIRPFMEPGEKLRHRYNCERVVGLEKRDGIFLIGETCLYVIDHFFIDESGRICEKFGEDELSVIDQALGVQSNSSGVGSIQELKPTGSWQETTGEWLGGRAWAYNGCAWGREKVQNVSQMAHPWHMWKLENVHKLLERRYQLRPVAIELFSMDGWNELLIFHKSERDEVFKNLLTLNLPRNSMPDSTISGASKEESNEGGRLSKKRAQSFFSKRWQNGEISNFQYLMHLNTLAGRGYNDLTQYPVFPWVLADYESEKLNLNDPSTFRALDKPMGALTPEREEEFKRRYESWDDPEIPSFHYGSHYSSAGTVLFYLIRLPPFSGENQKLQGGQFDHADRLFNSIKDTWLSASQGNTADVKELIPEFFYLPEMFENRFDLDFGLKQSGEKVGDVLLPPWANGSTREFVRKHREALESQYVSENLHLWIDLIFGYRQLGKAAVDATNVFFYLTYEGAVDIDSISEPAMKASILAQINHFGQTPTQLFQKPHPKRKWQQNLPPMHILKQHNLLVPHEIKSVAYPLSQVVFFREKILFTGVNRLLKPRSYNKYIAWGFPDHSLRFFTSDQDKLLSTHEGLHGSGQVQCAGLSKDGQILVTGGEDGVVAVWRLRKQGVRKQRHLQLQRALSAHTQRVTCLAVCQPYGLVVSGSDDLSVIFWDLSRLEYVRQLPLFSAAPSALYANEMTGDIVTAAGTTLSVWSINGDCLASVNTSQLPSDTIISITGSCFSDWMETNWFITGHQSGSIKLWRMEHESADSVTRMRIRSQSVPATNSQEGWKEESFKISTVVQRGKTGASSKQEYHLVLLKVLKWHKHAVTCVHLTNDLKQLFSGDLSGHLVSWLLPDETVMTGQAEDLDDKSCV